MNNSQQRSLDKTTWGSTKILMFGNTFILFYLQRERNGNQLQPTHFCR